MPVTFKDTPKVVKFDVDSPDRKERVKIIKKIGKDKKMNRKIARPLYKDIPSYKKYYKIIKYNEKHKDHDKLLKKEPLKFVKINKKTNTIFKKESEKIQYKIKEKEKKYIVTIIHKSGDQKQKEQKTFTKGNNKYKIKYDMKVYILNYVRDYADDL